MIRDKIIESGKVGLYKRLEYQISVALCLCAAVWSVLSFILMLFDNSGNKSWMVWVVLPFSIVTFFIILYRIFYTYTRNEHDIVSGVLLRYNHQADQIKHKLKYGLEFEQSYPEKNVPPIDDLLPNWNTERGLQQKFRKLLILSVFTAVLLISLSPWKAAFSTAFTFKAEGINDNNITWVSDTTAQVGQPYTLLALVKDTGDISAKLFLNDLKINYLYKNDTLFYAIESVNQDLYFTWRDGDKILSSFRVEVLSNSANTYKILLTPPSYIQQEQVDFINPRKIEAMEGSLMRIQEYVDEEASTLYIKDSIAQFNKDILLMNSAECFAMVKDDTAWLMTIDVIKDKRPSISIEWDFDTTARAYTAIGTFQDDFGVSNVFRRVNFIRSGKVIDSKRYNVTHDKGLEGDFADYFRRKDLWKTGIDAIEVSYGVCDNNEVKGSQCAYSRKLVLTVPNQDTWDDEKDQEVQNMENTANRLNISQSNMNERLEDIRNERMTEAISNANNQEIIDLLESLESLSDQKDLLSEELETFMLMSEEFNDAIDTNVLNPLIEEDQEDNRREELMDKIREALEKGDQESVDDALEELSEMESKKEMSLEMLERMLSQLMKENALKDAIEALDKLSKEEDTLDLDEEDALSKQEEINEKFDDIKKDIQEGKELLGEESEEIDQLSEEIDNALQNLSNEMQQGAPSESSKSSTAQKMKELSSMLSMAMKSAKQKQLEMDLATLQQLLENLVDLSLIEEDLFLSITSSNVGVYTKERKVRNQALWNKNFDAVKDTLLALASRSPTAQKPIIDGILRIEKRQGLLDKSFERGSQANWATQAQGVMMEVNEIALLLDEALQNIQMNLSGQMQGSQMCENPGGSGQGQSGKPSKEGGLQDIMSNQAAMGQQGEKEGEGGEGQQGNSGEGGGDEADKGLAALIQEQAKIRNALESWLKASNLEREGRGLLDQMKRQEQMLSEGTATGSQEYSEGLQNIDLQLLKLEQAANKQGEKESRKSFSPVVEEVVIIPEEVQQKISQILQRRKRPQMENPGLIAFYDKLWRSFTQ
tara:strand:- start:2608 stop:5757 length:3150 start_codon:yes stop_codon:yes gene_type:complete